MKIPCVYILASRQNRLLHINVTSDLLTQMGEHKKNIAEGFSRLHGVHDLVYFELHERMEDAILREKELKRWTRVWIVRLIKERNPEWRDLHDDIADWSP